MMMVGMHHTSHIFRLLMILQFFNDALEGIVNLKFYIGILRWVFGVRVDILKNSCLGVGVQGERASKLVSSSFFFIL